MTDEERVWYDRTIVKNRKKPRQLGIAEAAAPGSSSPALRQTELELNTDVN
jgi:hypothetical protein